MGACSKSGCGQACSSKAHNNSCYFLMMAQPFSSWAKLTLTPFPFAGGNSYRATCWIMYHRPGRGRECRKLEKFPIYVPPEWPSIIYLQLMIRRSWDVELRYSSLPLYWSLQEAPSFFEPTFSTGPSATQFFSLETKRTDQNVPDHLIMPSRSSFSLVIKIKDLIKKGKKKSLSCLNLPFISVLSNLML